MTAEAAPFVTALVLSAGRSSRMGRPVALLPLAGRCVLQHVIDEAATSRADEIVLVLGGGAQEIRAALSLPARARVVRVADPEAGIARSLATGLAATDGAARAAAVLLGDQPGVTASLIDRAIEEFFASAAPAVRPVHGRERVPGHPVVLDRTLWSELERRAGDEGARALLSSHSDWLHSFPIETQAPPDLDTWDDYLRVREQWEGGDGVG